MRLRTILYSSAIAAVGVAALGYQRSSPSASTAPRSGDASADAAQARAEIPLASAEPATVPDYLVVTGNVVADDRSDVVPDTAGKVIAVLVDRGDRVTRGQPLVRLDTRAASLTAAEARALARSAQAQRAVADDECRTSETLYREGAITRTMYQREQLACQQAGSQVAASEARQRLSAKAVSDGVIRAPFGGVITDTWVSPGEWAAPGARLVTVVDDDPLVAELEVPEAAATRIVPGQRVELESITRPGTVIAAAVTRLGAEVSPVSRSLVVEVELPRGTGVPAGTFVEGRIAIATRELPSVPRTAVARRGSTWRAWIARDGVLVERVVQLGPDASPTHVTITRGVAAGEQVAAQAGPGVADGTRLP